MIPPAKSLVGSERILAALIELAGHPQGISLDELAKALDSPKPTVHRALASLRKMGLARQTGRGMYELGDEFLRLAFRFHDARPTTSLVEPLLIELAARFGETTHYAVLEGAEIVYHAKVDPPSGAMRLTSTVGGRNSAHSTAVGKILLAELVAKVSELTATVGSTLDAYTPNTIVDPARLMADIERSRMRGYGLDDQENELGVNCIAFPVTIGAAQHGAISVSAITHRMGIAELVEAAPEISETIRRHLGAASG